MFKNYLKIALRSLRRHAGYASMNVIGLALGLASCILIGVYVQDELRYERFHENADRIVRITENQNVEGRVSRLATTYAPLAPALKAEIPLVEDAVRFMPYPMLVSVDNNLKFQEDRFTFVDSTFLEMFTFSMLEGDPLRALAEPFSVVLTESTALKYFGRSNPLGERIEVRDDEESFLFTVTGIVEDPPSQTHFRFSILASIRSLKTWYSYAFDVDNWEHPQLYTYAQLSPGASIASLQSQLPDLALKYMGERRVLTRALDAEWLSDIRLHSQRENDISPGSNIAYIYIFSLIALFVLCIACVNFVNLATARAAGRAREVGMRKTLGAYRSQLIRQFLMEAFLMTSIAVVAALVLAYLLMPVFNALTDKSIELTQSMHWSWPLLFVGTVLLIGLMTGGYPAFYLSKFLPVRVLKGASTPAGRPATARLRQGLVVFQFTISIALIIGTLVVQRQLDYLQNQRLGFDKEHVVLVPLRDLENQFNHESLKSSWERLVGVESVTASSGMPGLGSGVYDFMIKPEESAYDSLEMYTLTVDHDYIRTYDMEIVEGRDFSEYFSTDSSAAFILNERAAEKLGWEQPLGQQLTLQVWFNREVNKTGQVVGIVKDFQYNSLHKAIEPMLLHIFPGTYYYDYLSVRVRPENVTATLASLEELWTAFNPSRPFEYTFLDEKFDALYRTESRLSKLFGVFALLAVAIACLGLFALAAFTAQQRTKEIGIRKVLGASVVSLVGLLTKDFLRLVLLAFIIAVPISYFAMQYWLTGFADRISLGITIFLFTGVASIVIAFLTVSYQSIRAALSNSVEALKYE